jgi:small subunit ribosomal protein S6
MRQYELTFIVRADIPEDDVNATVDQVQKWITVEGNEVRHVDRWGRRRLAYAIQDQREGHYVRLEALMAPGTLNELERNLKLSDAILRYLLVRMEEN